MSLKKLQAKLASKRKGKSTRRGGDRPKITNWAKHKGKFGLKAQEGLEGKVISCTSTSVLVECQGTKRDVTITGDTENLEIKHTEVSAGDTCMIDVTMLPGDAKRDPKPWIDTFAS
jgi:hypothetical protein